MLTLTKAQSPLRGEIKVPGDKSISHRAVMFASLAKGDSVVTNFLDGDDCNATIDCFGRLGIFIERSWEKPDQLTVHGLGLHGLYPSSSPIVLYTKNSGTTTRILCGILAPQHFDTLITGDDSVNKRPMRRVMEPLNLMGGRIASMNDDGCAPLRISGSELYGIVYHTPVASAQVKSAILCAGLYANGTTTVIEPAKSRDHTERMLRAFGAEIDEGDTAKVLAEQRIRNASGFTKEVSEQFHLGGNLDPDYFRSQIMSQTQPQEQFPTQPDLQAQALSPSQAPDPAQASRGQSLLTLHGTENIVTVHPAGQLHPCDILVPGDISSAAYFIAAALLVPGSEVLLHNVGMNPTRDGILRVARAMGGSVEVISAHNDATEPYADLLVRSSALHGTEISGELIPTLIDEIPVIAVMAACAEGTTIIRDAAELKVKESNRIQTVTEGLTAMGAKVTPTDDGMIIEGQGMPSDGSAPLHGAEIKTYKDHRLAMSFAVASLVADGDTVLDDEKCASVSYPAFFEDLGKLQG